MVSRGESSDFGPWSLITWAGNHDITLDAGFYQEHGASFHNKSPQSPEQCLSLLTTSPSITYLCHSSATVRLAGDNGPRTTFKVFGSPYSPRMGTWAFGYERSGLSAPDLAASTTAITSGGETGQTPDARRAATAADIWAAIPLDADIVVTHTPPHMHCDESVSQRRALGCEELRRVLWRVRPRLAICGHVHEGRGATRVRWDIDGHAGSINTAYAEAAAEMWDDPGAGAGNGKLSLVDLTSKGGKRALENDGAHPAHKEPDDFLDGAKVSRPSEECDRGEIAAPGFGTRGLGGDPDVSARCDREALWGRMGRRETCIVNCAIMANSYPHAGGKRFNKPIVVDLDLPVWEADDEGAEPA